MGLKELIDAFFEAVNGLRSKVEGLKMGQSEP